MKTFLAFLAGVALTAAAQSFAQLNGEMTIPNVTIRDITTQKDIMVCKYAMFMANGHYVMCARN